MAAGVAAQLWLLVIVMMVTSAIGLFYYLRIIVAMCERVPEAGTTPAAVPAITAAGGWTLAVLTVLLLWLGIAPAPLIRLLQATVVHLG